MPRIVGKNYQDGEESGNTFSATAATHRPTAASSDSIVAYSKSNSNSSKKNDDDTGSVLSVYTKSPPRTPPNLKRLLSGGGDDGGGDDDGSLSFSFSSGEKNSSTVARKKIRLPNENWPGGNASSFPSVAFAPNSPSTRLQVNNVLSVPVSINASASLPAEATIAASRRQASRRMATSMLEPTSVRIKNRKKDREPAALAFDNNKKERKGFFSSISVGHEVLSSMTGQINTRVSTVGPGVPASCLAVKGADESNDQICWNSLNSSQAMNERKIAHKRTLQVHNTTNYQDASFGGYVVEFNKSVSGANFEVMGTSPEDIWEGKTKAVKCLTCGHVLPDSIGLSQNFRWGVRDSVTIGNKTYDPLRRHLKRCGSNTVCNRCESTLEEYELLHGHDYHWGQHESQCKKWHEQFEGLKQLQTKFGTWRVDSRHTNGLTAAEKKAVTWRWNQHKAMYSQWHTEYQKRMLADTFPGWYKNKNKK